MVLMPFAPMAQDYFELEIWYTRYVMSERATWGEESSFYRQVPIERLFDEVKAAFETRALVTVLYDRSIQAPGARAEVLDAFKRCLPEHTLDQGRWIDAYSVTREQFSRRACDLGARIELASPSGVVPAGSPLDFSWRLDAGEQAEYEVVVEQRDDRVLWLEAEDLESRDGWLPQGHLASGFGGRAYLADERAAWRPQVDATHRVSVSTGGTYTVWTRVYRRRDDGGPIALAVAGKSFALAEIASDQLNQWLWQRLGEVILAPGTSELTLTRNYPDPAAGVIFQIFLDAIVFARDPDFDPNRETQWRTFLATGPVTSSEPRHHLRAGLPAGGYRWRVTLRNGERLVDWKGRPVLESAYAGFEVVR
jgi:hypothetical protein